MCNRWSTNGQLRFLKKMYKKTSLLCNDFPVHKKSACCWPMGTSFLFSVQKYSFYLNCQNKIVFLHSRIITIVLLQIILTSGEKQTGSRYQYTACLGSGQAEEKPAISLLGYARSFASSADVKTKTKDSYRLMCNHLETYGDITIDRITTDYLQDYIQPLQLVRIIDFAV